jgi:putative transposase
MKYRFMREHVGAYRIRKMATTFGVSSSGYYAWLVRPESRQAAADRRLTERIKGIQDEHRHRYGSPRVTAELAAAGVHVSKNRVARLMRGKGLNAVPRKRFVVTTDSRHQEPVCRNIVDRAFSVAAPNRVWVSDITYLPTRDGWLYLCVILDLFKRKIVGWSLRCDLSALIVQEAFLMAQLNRRPGSGLIFHSDRGIQYCSAAFGRLLAGTDMTIRQSMSRKGNCWDNACSESFFKTLKREVDFLDGKHSRAAVRGGVFEYIEVYYNRKRRHSTIGYLTPEEAEQLTA